MTFPHFSPIESDEFGLAPTLEEDMTMRFCDSCGDNLLAKDADPLILDTEGAYVCYCCQDSWVEDQLYPADVERPYFGGKAVWL